tara:strand:- start:110 stop:739 length:630 start_codon:yes stop_codon:yes gene_type:complete
MITFETLFELLRKEKFNQELQKIDDEFFRQIVQYLKEKTAILEKETQLNTSFSADSRKTQLQLENAKKLIKELYEKRESKILSLALSSSRSEIIESGSSLLKEEKKLYKEILETLNKYREGIVKNMLAAKKVSVKKNEVIPKDIKTTQKPLHQGKTIRFLQSVPKFVANDLNVYGPFEPEDISHLPLKSANLLIKKNRAEVIKIEDPKD